MQKKGCPFAATRQVASPFRFRLAGWLVGAGTFLAANIASAETPVRAYYWNIGDGASADSVTDSARIARFKALGVREVHLWLNENRATPACGYVFHYTEGGAALWTAGRLEESTRALQAAALKVVYILSPDIRTISYIASLAAPGGPLDVAARFTGVDIELDVEGNGASPAPCPGDGLSLDDADRRILQTIHAATPTSRIVISTIQGFDARHPVLMDGADAISPQLYGAHYALPLAKAKAGFAYFRSAYPTKPLWVGLSVECAKSDADTGRCSRALLESEVKLVADAHTADGPLVPKYVIWGEREAQQCPAKPLCSVFAEDYLTQSAGH
jgi:hypothetical protein